MLDIDTFCARGSSTTRGGGRGTPRAGRLVCCALAAVAAGAGCAIDADPQAAVSAQLVGDGAPAIRHCVAPWEIDWNTVLQVEGAAIVTDFCTEVPAGAPYIPEVLWYTNTEDGIEGGPVLYPLEYVPLAKAPMTDFLHKLIGVRYVVQPGGLRFSFLAPAIEQVTTVGALFRGSTQFTPPQLALPATSLLGRLPPLPPGSYSAEIHFVMSATHCDGQTADRAKSCLPAGDSVALTRTFVVTP